MKYLLILFTLLLTSCHRDGWHHTSIQNGNVRYDIAKLTHPSSSNSGGIELEITRFGKEIHGYINVHAFELPAYEDDPHATTLTISANCATKTFVIPLLEGGQRAKLTDTCLDYLLQTLELKPSVILTSGHFTEILDASNFERHYDALVRKPREILPQSIISFELY
ncbi:MAG: hypothetical protein KDK76_03825 [Chlamydiia bacterium]|nr:hypothetical protein [Chlamydiia bacterium]